LVGSSPKINLYPSIAGKGQGARGKEQGEVRILNHEQGIKKYEEMSGNRFFDVSIANSQQERKSEKYAAYWKIYPPAPSPLLLAFPFSPNSVTLSRINDHYGFFPGNIMAAFG